MLFVITLLVNMLARYIINRRKAFSRSELMVTMTPPRQRRVEDAVPAPVNTLTSGQLPKWAPVALLLGSIALMALVYALLAVTGTTQGFDVVGTVFFGAVLYTIAVFVLARLVEGPAAPRTGSSPPWSPRRSSSR